MHFRVGDAWSLARTIERGATNARLWRTMRDGICDPYAMDAHVERLLDLYTETIDRRKAVAINV
jgi:hypothetical protein